MSLCSDLLLNYSLIRVSYTQNFSTSLMLMKSGRNNFLNMLFTLYFKLLGYLMSSFG